MLSRTFSKGGWSRKASSQNWKLLRALHLSWIWASRKDRLSRSALGWAPSEIVVWTTFTLHVEVIGSVNKPIYISDLGHLQISDNWEKKRVTIWKMKKLSWFSVSQNIKKKEAGGAKPRPMGGGLLPPPPGVKAGGIIPPPGGQQTVEPSAAQTNTGDHCAFLSLCFLLHMV